VQLTILHRVGEKSFDWKFPTSVHVFNCNQQ